MLSKLQESRKSLPNYSIESKRSSFFIKRPKIFSQKLKSVLKDSSNVILPNQKLYRKKKRPTFDFFQMTKQKSVVKKEKKIREILKSIENSNYNQFQEKKESQKNLKREKFYLQIKYQKQNFSQSLNKKERSLKSEIESIHSIYIEQQRQSYSMKFKRAKSFLKFLTTQQQQELKTGDLSIKQSKFIISCKLGEEKFVSKCIENDPMIVYQYDGFKQTGLHWAVKRNRLSIVKLLIENKVYLDFKDCMNNAAIYYAILNKNEVICRLLLSNGASPWIRQDQQIEEVFSNFPIIKRLIKDMRFKHIAKKMMKSKMHNQFSVMALNFLQKINQNELLQIQEKNSQFSES